MISMTGFAYAETQIGSSLVTVELKSYNNRYLDLVLSLPSALSPWEPTLREWLASAIARGRVELNVRVKDQHDDVRVKLNVETAVQYKLALETLRKVAGIKEKVGLSHLLAVGDLFHVEKEKDNLKLWEAIEPVKARVLESFQNSRAQEGARLEADIRKQWAVIDQGRLAIAEQSTTMEAQFKENLKRKFDELSAELDENRLLTETALLLVRYGINEELVRLGSHLQAFETGLVEGGAVGKKLDFLCQEIGREINTIGSKTTYADVQQRVVGMKDALENIREQLRNVE